MDKAKAAIAATVDALDVPSDVHRRANDAMLDVYEDHFNAALEDPAVTGINKWAAKGALAAIQGVRWVTKTPDDYAGDED